MRLFGAIRSCSCPSSGSFSIRCWVLGRRLFFFFNDTATTEIYTLSLHDALPIYLGIGIGGALVPFLAVWLTRAVGWQGALQVIGGLIILVATRPGTAREIGRAHV